FHHHLWYVRSRMGAWDHPNRAHKRFIDIHCQANAGLAQQFLPGNLGWWAFKTWQGPMGEPTHADDIEYLAAKALGNNYGLSLMGINPANVGSIAALPRLAEIVRRYERLRRANYFTDEVRRRLQQPGDEFTLVQDAEGQWQFRPARYDKHKVQGSDDRSLRWTVANRFERQPLQLRIEALTGIAPYEHSGGILLTDFSDVDQFNQRAAQPGIAADLARSTDQVKVGSASGRFTATNSTGTPIRAWCKVGKTFTPPLNLTGHEALGLWVHGDGQGEVLNLQQTSPSHQSHGVADHYITIDFNGWRYFDLLEPEAERYVQYAWPYGGHYATYRESILPASVDTLSLWYNQLPPKATATCYLGPIRALPTVPLELRNPVLQVGGKKVSLPVVIATGQFLELRQPGQCRLYGPGGEEIRQVVPAGEIPVLEPGENHIEISFDPGTLPPRAYVSVITQGTAFGGKNPEGQIHGEFLEN
ncbi:MAG: hypothetical protein ACYC6Y_30945, partial [Thermoguttaceae bacterium]